MAKLAYGCEPQRASSVFPVIYLQIKLDIVPDKGWQSEDMFVPAGYHMDTSISDEEGSPPENDQASFSYPAGLGSVLMNGCFGTGYKEGDLGM